MSLDPPIIISRRNYITNVSDIAVLRVFFGNSETWRYRQDLAQYWFEIASESMDVAQKGSDSHHKRVFLYSPGLFGGLFGLTAGFSIISGCEILYFLFDQLGEFMYKRCRKLLPRRVYTEETFIIYP